MKVISDLKSFEKPDYAVVTIGTFDGVHIGHQVILNRLIQEAKSHDGSSILITFWPHPRFVLKNDDSLKLLSTFEEKSKHLENLGLDYLIKIPFTPEFSHLSAEEFLNKVLIDGVSTRKLLIGYDHRFGNNREGDITYLRKESERFGYSVEEIPRQDIEDIGVSSTKVRNYLSEGKVAFANALLNRSYSIMGRVIHGNKLGRTIDFPTANIEIVENYKLLPKDGVYAVKANIEGQEYSGMLNIGFRPTVSGEIRTVEVHLFNFNSDIYEREIEVFFIDFLREEIKFDTVNDLKIQLTRDKENALKILS